MGDWHLQPLDPNCRQYRRFLLQGPLGPETLKTAHGLEAEEMLGLYGLLQHYTAVSGHAVILYVANCVVLFALCTSVCNFTLRCADRLRDSAMMPATRCKHNMSAS